MAGDWRPDLGLPHACQLFHTLQMQAAEQEGVDPFDVSLHLLVRHVPRWLAAGLSPLEQIQRHGRAMGLIRPSTRRLPHLPGVPWHHLAWPPRICLWSALLAILTDRLAIAPVKSLLPDLFGAGGNETRLTCISEAEESVS